MEYSTHAHPTPLPVGVYLGSRGGASQDAQCDIQKKYTTRYRYHSLLIS